MKIDHRLIIVLFLVSLFILVIGTHIPLNKTLVVVGSIGMVITHILLLYASWK